MIRKSCLPSSECCLIALISLLSLLSSSIHAQLSGVLHDNPRSNKYFILLHAGITADVSSRSSIEWKVRPTVTIGVAKKDSLRYLPLILSRAMIGFSGDDNLLFGKICISAPIFLCDINVAFYAERSPSYLTLGLSLIKPLSDEVPLEFGGHQTVHWITKNWINALHAYCGLGVSFSASTIELCCRIPLKRYIRQMYSISDGGSYQEFLWKTPFYGINYYYLLPL